MNYAKQQQAIDVSSSVELRQVMELAIGRLFGMMMRPHQPGDLETYEELRALVYAISARLGSLDKDDSEE